MSVHIEWDNDEQTAILWSFLGRWTWGEFDDALKVMADMLASVDHQVDTIGDVRQMSILPPDLVSRVKANYLQKNQQVRFLILVGMEPDLQLFWNTFTDLPYASQLKAYYFDSLEDAREFSASSGNGV